MWKGIWKVAGECPSPMYDWSLIVSRWTIKNMSCLSASTLCSQSGKRHWYQIRTYWHWFLFHPSPVAVPRPVAIFTVTKPISDMHRGHTAQGVVLVKLGKALPTFPSQRKRSAVLDRQPLHGTTPARWIGWSSRTNSLTLLGASAEGSPCMFCGNEREKFLQISVVQDMTISVKTLT